MTLHVGLLEADHVGDRFLPIAGGYREMFAAWMRPHAPGLRWSCFDACHGELPSSPEDCDGFICTGSRASAYGSEPWIAELAAFVRALHDARKPYVGICFGHQVLARALGGEVARAPGGWGVGVHAMSIAAAEPWMRPPLAECRLPYMHADQVTRLPAGAVALASSDHCDVAMFRVGETSLGIEGHPEFPAAYSEALLRDRANRIGSDRVAAALDSLATPTDSLAVGEWIARFLAQRRT